MNVHAIRLRAYNFKQNMKSVWRKIRKSAIDEKNDQSRVMTQEEQLDEELRESFPASDSPGHFSKSLEDKELH